MALHALCAPLLHHTSVPLHPSSIASSMPPHAPLHPPECTPRCGCDVRQVPRRQGCSDLTVTAREITRTGGLTDTAGTDLMNNEYQVVLYVVSAGCVGCQHDKVQCRVCFAGCTWHVRYAGCHVGCAVQGLCAGCVQVGGGGAQDVHLRVCFAHPQDHPMHTSVVRDWSAPWVCLVFSSIICRMPVYNVYVHTEAFRVPRWCDTALPSPLRPPVTITLRAV